MAKYASKYYIKKDIKLMIEKTNIIRQEYLIFKKLKFSDGYTNIKKAIPISSHYLLDALFEKILLELSKLLGDSDYKDLCIDSFIARYNNHPDLHKSKKYYMIKDLNTNKRHRVYLKNTDIVIEINNLITLVNKHQSTIRYIKKLRNKKLGHNDRKLLYNPRNKPPELKINILYVEIWNLIDELFSQLNKIYLSLFGGLYAPLETGDFELKRLNEILEKSSK